jgi:KUP system potassium uptake protein
MAGAALFYGDGIITPAISVLSAIEGLKETPGLERALDNWILPISAGHPHRPVHGPVARHAPAWPTFFGPITAASGSSPWRGLGLLHIVRRPRSCAHACRRTTA